MINLQYNKKVKVQMRIKAMWQQINQFIKDKFIQRNIEQNCRLQKLIKQSNIKFKDINQNLAASHHQPHHSSPQQTMSSNQRALSNQLHFFQQFISTYPKTVQSKFIPYLEFIKSEHSYSDGYKQKITKLQKKIGDKKELPNNFTQAKNLLLIYRNMNPDNYPALKFIEHLQRVADKVKALQYDHQYRSKYLKKFLTDYYPQKIDKNDSLSKQFEMSQKLSKMFGTHNLAHHDRKPKDPQFQVIPRLIYRVQEIAHYQSNAQQLGNILMLTYEGNQITGNKAYAVVDNNKIQWWEKKATGPPEISLVVENEQQKDGAQKQVNEDRQKQQGNKENRSNQLKFKLSHTFISHTEKITSVSISYDELFMLSTGMDKCVKLWCLRLKMLLAEFYGHVGTIWDVQWAPTGYYFLTGGADKLAILWKTDVPAPQRIFDHQGQVYKVNFLKNPDFICTAGEQGIFRIWKIQTAQCIREIAFPSQILNFELSFSGAYMGLYEINGQISIYDISKGDKINSFKILEGEHTTKLNTQKAQKVMKPHDIAFSEDEKQFVVVTSKHVMLYSMDNLAEKLARNIYEIEEERKEKKTPDPKQVIYMGRDVNLTYCKYTRKNLLLVGGTRKLVN